MQLLNGIFSMATGQQLVTEEQAITVNRETVDTVEKALADEVDRIAEDYNLPITTGTHQTKFRFLIKNLSQKENKPVVILIDEYDKFITHQIGNDEQREENRSQLKDFFSVLKGSGDYMRFLFITGVSRFTQVSIFSDLNNLVLISCQKRAEFLEKRQYFLSLAEGV